MFAGNTTVFGIVAALIILGLLILVFFVRSRSSRKFRRPLRELESFLSECKERLELLSPHAHDYFNSLGGEGARTYAHLTRIMAAISDRMERVAELSAIGTTRAIAEAEELLDSNFTFETGSMSSVLGEERFPDLPIERIEITVEKLFQDLGRRIATASHHSGLPKPPGRKRRDTFHSLHQAGINVPPEEEEE